MVHIVTRERAGSSAYPEDTFKVLLSFVNLVAVQSRGWVGTWLRGWGLPSYGTDYLLGAHVEEDQDGDAEDQVREQAAAELARDAEVQEPEER
jgi:hypothetical protein